MVGRVEGSAPDRTGPTAAFEVAVAGIVCGFLVIVISISFANLLLPAELRAFTPVIVGMALFSSLVLNLVAAAATTVPGAVSVVQEVPLVAMSGAAAAIAAAMGAASGHPIVVTIVAFSAMTTLLTGAILFALGRLRAGGLIRFMPYPVIAGFLAGTGWLILLGAAGVITGQAVDLTLLADLAAPNIMAKAVFALALLAAIVGASRMGNSMAVPIVVFAALGLFNVVVLGAGMSPDALRQDGWLVPMPASGRIWPPLLPADLGAIDTEAMMSALPALPGIVIVTVMALLMNATGIELDRGHDTDLDRELGAIGLQNAAAGIAIGLPGYPAVSLSALASRLGGSSRAVTLIVAAFCAAALLFGDTVLRLVPTPFLGGLLLWIGASLIRDWLFASFRRLTLPEYLIVVAIFLVIAAIGFTGGIFVGLIAAIGLFVVQYSRTDVVRRMMRGSDFQSNVEASPRRRESLTRHGHGILILRLQGYLFFGTADSLRKRILHEVAAPDARVRFVLIDCRRVTGIDSSAVLSFLRLGQAAAHNRFEVIVAGARAGVRRALERGGLTTESGVALRIAGDAERELTWCEDRLLDEVAPGAREVAPMTVAALLGPLVPAIDAEPLLPYLERVECAAGTVLIAQGSPSDDIYFVESGRAAVIMKGRDGDLSVAAVGAGAVVGEVSFYTGEPRTASVVAEEPTVAWRLTRAAIGRLQADAPDLAARFHRGLAAMLAARLASTDRLLAYLAD